MRFTEALSNKALLDFGSFGKLINQGYIILPDQSDKESHDLDDEPDELNKLDYLKDMKAYWREIADFQRDKHKPKLYALILQHLSDESLEAVQKEAGWPAVEQDTNQEALWQLLELKHKIHSASEVEVVVELVARPQLATTKQGAFEPIIVFKQRYTNALKVYKDQKNPLMMPQDKAMDVFSKLNNARYAEFKTTYINNLQMKACDPPQTTSKHIPKIALGNGLGSTFATAADYVDKKEQQKRRHNNQRDKILDKAQEQGKESGKTEKKEKRQVECFNCKGDHYVSQCPELLELHMAKEDANITAVTWEGSTFHTYQVNSIGMKGLGAMEVLLDNQVNISIMRLELLRMLEPVSRPIIVSDVGGVQLVASETGYLQDEKKQVLYSDIMHIDGHRFLVTICKPLQLTLQIAVERESASILGIALQGQLELLHSKGLPPYAYTWTSRVCSGQLP
jgi:hypothetical protein